ncbi:MAG TPA: hypothetical protein VI837_03070 [Blastocatellia bacterium]|nr:hypothetical protein [Blastocatellia bacterium]
MSEDVIQIGGVTLEGASRARLVKRGRNLEYFTIAYNSLEGLIAILVGCLRGALP